MASCRRLHGWTAEGRSWWKYDHIAIIINNMWIIWILWRSARSKDYTTRRRQLTIKNSWDVSFRSWANSAVGDVWVYAPLRHHVKRFALYDVRPKTLVSFLFPCRMIIIIARFLFYTVSHSNSLITIRVSP